MMPGPLLAVTVSESSRRGRSAGPLLVLGHGILESVLVIAVVLGLARFFSSPPVIGVVSLVGSAVMCWMGLGMIRVVRKLTLSVAASDCGTMNPAILGILTSLANPYWTLWWATIGVALLFSWPEAGWLGMVMFLVGHVLSDLAWYSLVGAGVAKGRKLMSDKTYRWLIGICGGALVAFGFWFAWHGAVTVGGVVA